jgi:hypothetical protein
MFKLPNSTIPKSDYYLQLRHPSLNQGNKIMIFLHFLIVFCIYFR